MNNESEKIKEIKDKLNKKKQNPKIAKEIKKAAEKKIKKLRLDDPNIYPLF